VFGALEPGIGRVDLAGPVFGALGDLDDLEAVVIVDRGAGDAERIVGAAIKGQDNPQAVVVLLLERADESCDVASFVVTGHDHADLMRRRGELGQRDPVAGGGQEPAGEPHMHDHRPPVDQRGQRAGDQDDEHTVNEDRFHMLYGRAGQCPCWTISGIGAAARPWIVRMIWAGFAHARTPPYRLGSSFPERMTTMRIQMELARILIRELNSAQLIELREVNPRPGHPARAFPIVIGLSEAIAIDRRLDGDEQITIGRPMTHDLLANTIEELGASLDSIAITKVVDGTFYALLNLTDNHGRAIEVDARPSDAIALGIAGDVPIFVDESVIALATFPTMDDSDSMDNLDT